MDPAVPRPKSAGLRGDWFFWTGFVLWGASIVPSLFPVLSPDLTYVWADQYSDVPGLTMALAAAALAIRKATSQRERVFWRLLVACIIGWLSVRGLYALIPYEQWGTGMDLASDLLYLGGYLCAALAVERRPDRHPGSAGGGRLQRVESAGTLVFAFGLLAYFVLIPSVFNPEVYASWVSSLLLYAVLDAFLVVRGISLLRSDVGEGWRRPIRWLTLAFAAWLVGDVCEGLMYLDVLPYSDPGTVWDLIWHVPAILLLASIRSRTWGEPRSRRPQGQRGPEVMERLTPGAGSLDTPRSRAL